MKLPFGYHLLRSRPKAYGSNQPGGGGWFSLVREPFSGAWQRGVSVVEGEHALAFSAVFACVTLIAADIGKLRIKLTKENAESGITEEMRTEDKNTRGLLALLKKPNDYQNYIKFSEQWQLSKLLRGNAYILKGRDPQTKAVNKLWVMHPDRTKLKVSDQGAVFYVFSQDNVSGLDKEITVPASEVIHDRMQCLFHPLVGVSPLFSAAYPATQGVKIQTNSTKFFENMSRPSGFLMTPGEISDEDAARLKEAWNKEYSGGNLGRTAVLSGGLKYESMTIDARDAQLIEQLKWSIEDVARAFHMPLFKIGGATPGNASIDALAQTYYNDCLHSMIENMEASLDEGLGLNDGYYTELDLDGLLRMDTAARYDVRSKGIAGGWLAPNEARKCENLAPVDGGDSCYMQQQNFSLEALAKRDDKEDPFGAPQRDPGNPADPTPTPPGRPPSALSGAEIEALGYVPRSELDAVELQLAIRQYALPKLKVGAQYGR